MKELGLDGESLEFSLTGITGSEKVNSKLVDRLLQTKLSYLDFVCS